MGFVGKGTQEHYIVTVLHRVFVNPCCCYLCSAITLVLLLGSFVMMVLFFGGAMRYSSSIGCGQDKMNGQNSTCPSDFFVKLGEQNVGLFEGFGGLFGTFLSLLAAMFVVYQWFEQQRDDEEKKREEKEKEEEKKREEKEKEEEKKTRQLERDLYDHFREFLIKTLEDDRFKKFEQYCITEHLNQTFSYVTTDELRANEIVEAKIIPFFPFVAEKLRMIHKEIERITNIWEKPVEKRVDEFNEKLYTEVNVNHLNNLREMNTSLNFFYMVVDQYMSNFPKEKNDLKYLEKLLGFDHHHGSIVVTESPLLSCFLQLIIAVLQREKEDCEEISGSKIKPAMLFREDYFHCHYFMERDYHEFFAQVAKKFIYVDGTKLVNAIIISDSVSGISPSISNLDDLSEKQVISIFEFLMKKMNLTFDFVGNNTIPPNQGKYILVEGTIQVSKEYEKMGEIVLENNTWKILYEVNNSEWVESKNMVFEDRTCQIVPKDEPIQGQRKYEFYVRNRINLLEKDIQRLKEIPIIQGHSQSFWTQFTIELHKKTGIKARIPFYEIVKLLNMEKLGNTIFDVEGESGSTRVDDLRKAWIENIVKQQQYEKFSASDKEQIRKSKKIIEELFPLPKTTKKGKREDDDDPDVPTPPKQISKVDGPSNTEGNEEDGPSDTEGSEEDEHPAS